MSSKDLDTVIIGSGFAGLSVAHGLQGQGVTVLDRGEPLDLQMASREMDQWLLQRGAQPGLLGLYTDVIDAEASVLRSRLPANQPQMPLSLMSANAMTYVQGGISNWWGGYAARLTRATFEQDGVLAWPVSHADVEPYYAEAARLMRVHGDPTASDYTVVAPLPGWDYWREQFADLFPQARVTPMAKNVTDADAAAQGLCTGNGHCAVCANDAKARPDNVFPTVDVLSRTRIDRIVFDGPKAVALQGSADGETFEVSFERLVIAAGGLENIGLLKRSALPDGVARHIGDHFQDHTTCEVLARLPRRLERLALGAEGGVEIPELSGYFEGIEVKTVFLPTPPTQQHIQAMVGATPSAFSLMGLQRDLDRVGVFYLQMEIPPEWNLRLRSRGEQTYIYSMPYWRHLPLLDAVVLRVSQRMVEAGIDVLGTVAHHRTAFGGHHYSGTTPMSTGPRAVVDVNQRLIGTDNVYINGGSVLPRCGGSGPTLTIAAMGLRLGRHLASRAQEVPAPIDAVQAPKPDAVPAC
jgi:glucose dehydrogenase